MSVIQSAWEAVADPAAASVMGEEIVIHEVPLCVPLTDGGGGVSQVRGGLDEGETMSVHLSAADLDLVVVEDGDKIQARGKIWRVIGSRRSGSGKAFTVEML